MGNRIDERNTAYKMFRLTSLGRAWREGEPVSPKFANDPNIGSRRYVAASSPLLERRCLWQYLLEDKSGFAGRFDGNLGEAGMPLILCFSMAAVCR